MGIPSYFSYIIRNYPKIISNIKSTNILFQHLFLDCNSIIYDSVRGLENKNYDNDIIDCVIINEVIKKINEYIHEVKPTKTIFIAFDGVAPFAKMNQQRTRRYKSDIISKVLPNASFAERSSDATQNETNKWDTTQITPGTDFMNLLSKKITEYYNNSPVSKGRKIIVSTSDEAGEGEHKLFHFIREHDLKEDNVMIYGLDSDLFMLSIFHNEYYKNAYIFREAPDFLQSKILVEQSKTDSNINNNCYMIDIELLRKYILKEMGFSDPKRIYDYAFLCFFLGNDFLPHFPALNIRTHGIQTLLDIYNQCFKNKPDKFIVIMEKGIFKIHWNHLEPLLKQLSHLEHDLLLKEYSIREKYNKWNFDTKLEEKNIQNMPIMYRMDENYICPTENEWETRYYNILFPTEYINPSVEYIKKTDSEHIDIIVESLLDFNCTNPFGLSDADARYILMPYLNKRGREEKFEAQREIVNFFLKESNKSRLSGKKLLPVLDFNGLNLTASELIRILTSLQFLNDISNVICFNIEIEDFNEMVDILQSLAGQSESPFWSNTRSALFVLNLGEDGIEKKLLIGESYRDFVRLNQSYSDIQFADDQTGQNGELRSPFFNANGQFIEFELLIYDGNKTLFEYSTKKALNKLVVDGGYKINNTHFKLGSKIHIDTFYYAERLFQNSFYCNRFAFLLMNRINSNSDFNDATKISWTFVGYGEYSDLLLSKTVSLLKAIRKDKKINFCLFFYCFWRKSDILHFYACCFCKTERFICWSQ